MTENYTKLVNLPPGWDVKYDTSTGKCYYINYLTKVMQLEDPRVRYKQFQNERCSTESIPLQPMHGSPYHVYPTNNFPAIKAFQGPHPSLQNVSASPLLSTKSQLSSALEMSQGSSPQNPRTGNLSRRQSTQETSFTNQIDTDAVVSKIQTMFPTAGENHIRLLLKKYMKSIFPKAEETLLLDILANSDNNVQKASEKLLAMGYTKREVTAPPKLSNREEERKHKEKLAAAEKLIPLRPKELTDEEKSQIKIRLQNRYNKIVERIILMALESVNYSEDRANQILQIVQQEDECRARKDAENEINRAIDNSIQEELQSVKESNLKESKTAETLRVSNILAADPVVTNDSIVVTIIGGSDSQNTQLKSSPSSSSSQKALQSYKSSKNLQKSQQFKEDINSISPENCVLGSEHQDKKKNTYNKKSNLHSSDKTSPSSSDRYRFRDKSDSLKNSPKGSTEDETDSSPSDFHSILGRIATLGHNNELAKGPDDSLLLADYITWNGANPDNTIGQKKIANGSDTALLTERSTTYTSHGRNNELCKGPKIGLAKGSIYSQLSTNNNIKCN